MVFGYDPLDEARDEIRLLTLHRGQANQPIQCSVWNVPLGEFSMHKEGIYKWSDGGAGWAPPRSLQSYPTTYASIDTPKAGDEWTPLQWDKVGSALADDTRGSGSVTAHNPAASLPRFFGANPDMRGLSLVPEFEALSYTWGDANLTIPIEINGASFPVTRNLFGALKRLRKDDRNRNLWVDAVCINQQDLDERSRQVRRMRAIYQRAQRVLVWLGDGADGSERAIELLEMLGGREKDVLKLPSFGYSDTNEWYGPQFNPSDGLIGGEALAELQDKNRVEDLRPLNLADPARFNDADWQALENFFLRHVYWNRAWIIQELTYGRSIKLYCGSRSMGWQTLDHIIYNENLRNPKSLADRYLVARFANLLNDSSVSILLRQNSATKEWPRALGLEREGTSLLHLLTDFRGCKSTDPRDKIYALLGLPSISDDIDFHDPDYTLPVSAIYQETTRSIIKYENSLRVLCLEQPKPQPRPHGLPSWCPDWSQLPSASDFRPLINIMAKDQQFASSRDSTPYACGLRINGGGKKDKRKLWSGRNMVLRSSEFFRVADGFPLSSTYHVTPEQAQDKVLLLDGIHCGVVHGSLTPVTSADLEGGSKSWRDIVLRWQEMLGPVTDPRDLRALANFLFTIVKGSAPSPPEEEGIWWPEVLIDKYRVWCGQMRIEDAEHAELHARLVDIDSLIKGNVKGWTLGVVGDGGLAMLPSRSQKGDVIAVLFGGDVPFVLRPVDRKALSANHHHNSRNRYYELVGTAYVHDGMMSGEAMELLKAGQKEYTTFMLV